MSVALDGPDGTTMVAEQRGLQKDTALHAKIAVSGMDFFGRSVFLYRSLDQTRENA